MKNSTFIGSFNIVGCFIIVLFSFFLIPFVHGTSNSDGDQILRSLRPLKYITDCAEFCKNVICQPIKECDIGVIVKNESYCECCEACVKFLDIGESCTDIIKGTLALGSQTRCKFGTTCENGKCTLDTEKESCLRHQDIRKNHTNTGKYEFKIWEPQCDRKGFYAAKQEKISRSFCVDKNGNKIFGSAGDVLKNTCACSRHIQKRIKENPLLFYVKPQEHCTASGSFDALQCIGNLCYCADMNTGHVKSELVTIDFLQNLDCYNAKIHKEDYLKDCEKELQRTKKIAYEFWKKGVTIHGIDIVRCDPDGTFSPVQCLPDRCICTDKMGSGIGQYAAELQKAYSKKMTCNCARDESSEHFQTLSCEDYGNYKPVTCFLVDECVCVDEDGENIALKEQKLSEIGSTETCINIIKDLSNYQYPNEDDESVISDNGYTDDY